MPDSLQEIAAAGWALSPQSWSRLSEYERSFAIAELTGQRTREYYDRRLRSLGFGGKIRVLDAACGIGQWSVALADMVDNVVGADIRLTRLSIGHGLLRGHGHENGCFVSASLGELPFADESFDGVFCYGALMFTPMAKTLKEFYRVLAPGGQVYVNVNSYGWYLHLAIDRGLRRGNATLVRAGVTGLIRSIVGAETQVAVGQRRLVRLVKEAGLKVEGIALEGGLGEGGLEPAYQGTHFGLASMWEVLAVKEG